VTPAPGGRRLSWDWFDGTIPDNVHLDEAAYVETSHSFLRFRSEATVGARFGRGASMYKSSMLDVGPAGTLLLGDFAMLQGARIVCEREIRIGSHSMLSWQVLLMDSYRFPDSPAARREILRRVPGAAPRIPAAVTDPSPIRIESNVWIGFGSCVLPGVTVGEGAIVGARSVVTTDVEPYTVVAGNPARFVRRIDPTATPGGRPDQIQGESW
jgi:acetyltransferase-like isoleucine patch superfamily enzyme